jgi:hypothetical protein
VAKSSGGGGRAGRGGSTVDSVARRLGIPTNDIQSSFTDRQLSRVTRFAQSRGLTVERMGTNQGRDIRISRPGQRGGVIVGNPLVAVNEILRGI